jgi:hypothetical protein
MYVVNIQSILEIYYMKQFTICCMVMYIYVSDKIIELYVLETRVHVELSIICPLDTIRVSNSCATT